MDLTRGEPDVVVATCRRPDRQTVSRAAGRYVRVVVAPVVDGLVGRDLEVELARRIMRDLCAGQASTLLIEGEAGIGKTRVVQCIIDDASARGVVVFRGGAHSFQPR